MGKDLCGLGWMQNIYVGLGWVAKRTHVQLWTRQLVYPSLETAAETITLPLKVGHVRSRWPVATSHFLTSSRTSLTKPLISGEIVLVRASEPKTNTLNIVTTCCRIFSRPVNRTSLRLLKRFVSQGRGQSPTRRGGKFRRHPVAASFFFVSNLRKRNAVWQSYCENKNGEIIVPGCAVYFRARATVVIIMVALWNRADHYIFVLWFLLSSFFFPRL